MRSVDHVEIDNGRLDFGCRLLRVRNHFIVVFKSFHFLGLSTDVKANMLRQRRGGCLYIAFEN